MLPNGSVLHPSAKVIAVASPRRTNIKRLDPAAHFNAKLADQGGAPGESLGRVLLHHRGSTIVAGSQGEDRAVKFFAVGC